MVPEKIVQLSGLMRHIIYESDVELISLEKEIEMIKNYIELQNLRTLEKEKFVLNIIGITKGKKIAPLLFLPFVENSFKHGLKSGIKNAFVKITIKCTGNVLNFEIENNKVISKHIKDIKHSGIGIENVKKRLQLIYPNQHSLKISKNHLTFKVLLQVQLK